MLNENWQDQHARLSRSHRRLQDALAKRAEPEGINYEPLDVLYHFCCDAFHLRDWIRADLPQHENDLQTLFQSSTALSACADIANGSKHLKLTGTPHTPGGHAVVAQKGTVITPGPAHLYLLSGDTPPPEPTEEVGTTQTTFKIDAGQNGTFDALELASQAVNDWDNWLNARGLL